METKHTQGKWVINKYTETTIESNGRTVANAGSYYDGTEKTHNENVFNAKLIASAPEMLEALKSMLFLFDRGLSEDSVGKNECNRVKELINQATE